MCGVNALRVKNIALAVELTKLFQIVHGQVVTEEVQRRVLQGTRVSIRQHEAITVELRVSIRW
jgi:hypothetical protein